MDWKEEFKSRGLPSGRRLHSQYEFTIEKASSPKIKVYLWEQADGYYFATTDHSIQNSKQGTPSRELNVHSTAEEALRCAIGGITKFVQEPFDKIRFILEDWV
jgi:hypothetical protein